MSAQFDPEPSIQEMTRDELQEESNRLEKLATKVQQQRRKCAEKMAELELNEDFNGKWFIQDYDNEGKQGEMVCRLFYAFGPVIDESLSPIIRYRLIEVYLTLDPMIFKVDRQIIELYNRHWFEIVDFTDSPDDFLSCPRKSSGLEVLTRFGSPAEFINLPEQKTWGFYGFHNGRLIKRYAQKDGD